MRIVNEAEFDEIVKDGITLVDFFADWCGPCKMLSPVLEELDNDYPAMTFVKVNCDNDMHLAERFNIMTIPAVLIFKQGDMIAQSIGYKGKEEMKKFIEDSLNK